MARVLLVPKRLASTEECGQGNGHSFNSSVRIPLSILNGFEPDRLEMALDLIYWQENEGRRMALNGNILLPSFFCLLPIIRGFRATGRPPRRGSVSSAVHPRRASRPRSRRDAQETAGGGFRGSIQAPQPRGSRHERGEAFVRNLHPDPDSPRWISHERGKRFVSHVA